MDRPGWAGLLDYRQIHLVSLRENIDTTSATGRCFLSMMGAIHQMERELRAERAAAGRASARARGPDQRATTHRSSQGRDGSRVV